MRAYAELVKAPIALAAAATAAAGFTLCRGAAWTMVAPVAGVFLLACGACALNQFQERRIDALMERTRARPLVTGRVQPAVALILAAVLLISGALLLVVEGGALPLALGLFAVAWYNGVYTYLKLKTAFAVVPGALVGAAPPLVGWTAAGGSPADPRALGLALFLVVWQIPHFWLLLLRYGREYEQAGLPTLGRVLSERQLAWTTAAWVALAAVVPALLTFGGVFPGPWPSDVAVVILAAWILLRAATLPPASDLCRAGRAAFRDINIFALTILVVLCVDHLA